MGALSQAHFPTTSRESVRGRASDTTCLAWDQVQQMGTQAASPATASRLRALAGESVESTPLWWLELPAPLDEPSDVIPRDTCRVATNRTDGLCGTPSAGSLTALALGADRGLQATTRVPHIPEAA